MLRRLIIATSAIVAFVAIIVLVLALNDELERPGSGVDIRPALLLVGLTGLNCLTYAVWFNRWNIAAHASLAFSIVAYWVPIALLGQLDRLSSDALDLYYRVICAGLFFAVLGVLAGWGIAHLFSTRHLSDRAGFDRPEVRKAVRARVLVLATLSLAGVFVAFGGMGFIPALTEDPLTAKFFRGEYAAAYQPVAPLYRGATSVLGILLPLVFLYAIKLRNLMWLTVGVSTVLALLLGLMREPAVSGVLLLVGAYVAVRRRPLLAYFALLLASYFVGSALYYVLGLVGFGSFGDAPSSSMTWLDQAAAGAPDIKDQIQFLTSWLARPEYTHGLTWIGGLVPGNYPWNPSVWSLSVVNPGMDITSIASGGFRLPAPIWGLVSFGWTGVVIASIGTGAAQGFLAGVAKQVLPSRSVEITAYWLVLYIALMEVVPAFFRLSYLSILQLIIVLAVFFWPVRRHGDSVRTTVGRSLGRRTGGAPARRVLG